MYLLCRRWFLRLLFDLLFCLVCLLPVGGLIC